MRLKFLIPRQVASSCSWLTREIYQIVANTRAQADATNTRLTTEQISKKDILSARLCQVTASVKPPHKKVKSCKVKCQGINSHQPAKAAATSPDIPSVFRPVQAQSCPVPRIHRTFRVAEEQEKKRGHCQAVRYPERPVSQTMLQQKSPSTPRSSQRESVKKQAERKNQNTSSAAMQ